MTRTRIQSGPVPASGAGPARLADPPPLLTDNPALIGSRRSRPLVREDILDAVDDQLERVGYARMTIEEVARLAGVGKGSIYLHFASKEDLALSSIDRLVRRLLDRLAEIAGEPLPAADRLRRMLETRVLFRFDHVNQDAVSLDEMLAILRSALLQRREEWFERESQLLARVISEARAAGDAKDAPTYDHALRDARALVTATNALLPYSLSKSELGRRSLLVDRVIAVADLLLCGLSLDSTASGPNHDPIRQDRGTNP
ncbi:MAG TPA: helix-turn-helix domain-containing protein [Candidatus Eisenbacteria bacterium]